MEMRAKLAASLTLSLAGCLVAAVVTATLFGLPTIGIAAAAGCQPGVHHVGSVLERTFCGKASAKVTVPGNTATIKNGSCKKTSNYFTINIGTIVIANNVSNRPAYFGLEIGKTILGGTPVGHDGTFSGGVVSFVINHKSYAIHNASVTLKSNRTKGSFSGTLFSGGTASGTFSCS
jgi:hypothetical protein